MHEVLCAVRSLRNRADGLSIACRVSNLIDLNVKIAFTFVAQVKIVS
jgi:acylphosphatase